MKVDELVIKLIKDKVKQEVEDIFNPKNKEKFVDMINDNVNIPILREKDEAIVFDALYDLVHEFVKKIKK
jgi:hypothetical protein|tara:strand:+ start:600 stop:809 length:210 start_codon:yes stop_codon:yes gene_type:complete